MRGADALIAGFLLGVLVGLVLARAVWSWIAWREWRDARRVAEIDERREARLERELLRRIIGDDPPIPLTR